MLLLFFILFSCKKKQTSEATSEVSSRNTQSTQTLKFLSYAVRDVPPSVQEVQSFLSGQNNLEAIIKEWLKSKEHQNKVKRYFKDLLGVALPSGHVLGGTRLKKNSVGAYRLALKPDCTAQEVVQKEAWWLKPKETAPFCATSVSNRFFANDNASFCLFTVRDDGTFLDECGCGPKQLFCVPDEIYAQKLERALRDEIPERGLFSYENNLSWHEFLAGDFFYGNKFLYFYYSYAQGKMFYDAAALEKVTSTLDSFEEGEQKRIQFPDGGPRRGVVTAPSFLFWYNNMRARTRALVQTLLCKDVDGSLNSAGIQRFVNPSLTDADRAHGEKAGCASCHYGMDNIGSAFLRYDQAGSFAWYFPPQNLPSEKAFAFGEEGEGPAFVTKGFIEKGPTFSQCMAKTAWKTFSGLSWEAVPEDAQKQFAEAASVGPQSLIQAILLSQEIQRSP
jgi:hypothetical protein